MFSQNNLDAIMSKIMSQLGMDNSNDNNCKNDKNKKTKKKCLNLTPAQIMVISGILTDVLSVQSLLVDRDQSVQIILEGSLKRKTELEKTLDDIGDKSFDEVMKAFISRL